MRTLLTAAAALLITVGTANANIIFDIGNHPQPDEVNVFFAGGETGLTLTNGEAGQNSGIPVNFTTLGDPLQILRQDSGGQAQIFCFANCIDNSALGGPNMASQLGSISMRAGLGYDWGDAIINLDNGIGTALVTVTDNFGDDFTYELGNGQNFLTMFAEPGSGERIVRIDVTNANPGEAFGFNQFKQPRVSDVQAAQQVDEPSTLAILGSGLIFGGIAIRRRQNKHRMPGHGFSVA